MEGMLKKNRYYMYLSIFFALIETVLAIPLVIDLLNDNIDNGFFQLAFIVYIIMVVWGSNLEYSMNSGYIFGSIGMIISFVPFIPTIFHIISSVLLIRGVIKSIRESNIDNKIRYLQRNHENMSQLEILREVKKLESNGIYRADLGFLREYLDEEDDY